MLIIIEFALLAAVLLQVKNLTQKSKPEPARIPAKRC
jgi:hypothetical protein